MARVYRVQDFDGRGPFRPGFSHQWSDMTGPPQLLPWMQEFGADLIARRGLPGEFYGCAVRSLKGVDRWFTPSEQQRLAALGFSLVSIKPDRILAESTNQLVFACRQPLSRAAVTVPWPHESRSRVA